MVECSPRAISTDSTAHNDDVGAAARVPTDRAMSCSNITKVLTCKDTYTAKKDLQHVVGGCCPRATSEDSASHAGDVGSAAVTFRETLCYVMVAFSNYAKVQTCKDTYSVEKTLQHVGGLHGRK